MDEAGLAQQVIEACASALQARGGRHAVCVCLRIGPAAAVDPYALRFCFDALKQGAPLRFAALDIECPASGPPDDAAALYIRYLEFGTETQLARGR